MSIVCVCVRVSACVVYVHMAKETYGMAKETRIQHAKEPKKDGKRDLVWKKRSAYNTQKTKKETNTHPHTTRKRDQKRDQHAITCAFVCVCVCVCVCSGCVCVCVCVCVC